MNRRCCWTWHHRGKFCVKECYNKYRREQAMKNCESCGVRFLPAHRSSKYCSIECSCKCKAKRPWQRGELSPRWKGGITPENHRIRNSPEQKQWASDVKERDGFRCQICGVSGGNLHSHHILAFALYPEHRLDGDNGVTLHTGCHKGLENGLRAKNPAYIKLNTLLGYRIFAKVVVL